MDYEAIQGDLFDHLLAILPEFGLRSFQSPGGADLLNLVDALRSAGQGTLAHERDGA